MVVEDKEKVKEVEVPIEPVEGKPKVKKTRGTKQKKTQIVQLDANEESVTVT